MGGGGDEGRKRGQEEGDSEEVGRVRFVCANWWRGEGAVVGGRWGGQVNRWLDEGAGGGREVREATWDCGGEGFQRFGARGRNRLQVLILVRRRPRAGAGPSGKAVGGNMPPREDRSTVQARSQRRRGEDMPCDAAA